MFQTALAALDIALWDLEGKRLGVPVARLLGGAIRTGLRGYASHWLQGADTPDRGARRGAQEAVRAASPRSSAAPSASRACIANEAAEIAPRRCADGGGARRRGP